MNTYTIAAIILGAFILIWSYKGPLSEAVKVAKLINEGKKEHPDLNKAIETMFEELKPTEDKENE